ncbi:DNA-binding PucR family transcriptional regulator [Actinopolyspora lacussalsi]|nr:DNA-binding PucR family transcriptional regulator [Actinopolyspora lacussalsi]
MFRDSFIEDTIGPVIEYDRLRRAELTRTLEVLLMCSGEPTSTAEILGVHPNTVERRIDRISELIGPVWQSGRPAAEIRFALRLHNLVEI